MRGLELRPVKLASYLLIMSVCELASGGGKREEIPNVTFRHHWIVNLQLQTYVWIPTTTTLGKTRTLYHKSVFFCLLMFANTISFKPYHAKNVFSSGRTAYGSITTKTCSQPRFPGFSPTRPPGNEKWPENEVPTFCRCYLRCFVFRLAVDFFFWYILLLELLATPCEYHTTWRQPFSLGATFFSLCL